jgi:hypothetical protein
MKTQRSSLFADWQDGYRQVVQYEKIWQKRGLWDITIDTVRQLQQIKREYSHLDS